MATPPTLVADYESTLGWASATSPKVTSSFNGSLGDVLVALVAHSNDEGSENITFTSSPAETWTEDTETTGTLNFDVWMQSAHAILSAARTGMTVSAAIGPSTTAPYNVDVAHFTGSNGVGAAARLAGDGVAFPSLSITTQFDNSAIAYLIADWAATDAATRTHRTVNGYTPTAANGQEFLYYRDTTNWMVVAAHIPDAGLKGPKSVGISEPATGDCLVIAVEVRGTPTAPVVSIGEDSWSVVGGVFGRIAVENDGGDPITAREWKVISGPAEAGNVVGTDAVSIWPPTTQGSYVLRYTATNGLGSTYDEINVEVGAAVEGPQNSGLRT